MLLTESMIWLWLNFDLFIYNLFHWKKFYFSDLGSKRRLPLDAASTQLDLTILYDVLIHN